MLTKLEAWTIKDLEPVSNHLTDFCNQSTDELEFCQALIDRIKEENRKSPPMSDIWRQNTMSRQIEIEQYFKMSGDFLPCCLMDEQFVS